MSYKARTQKCSVWLEGHRSAQVLSQDTDWDFGEVVHIQALPQTPCGAHLEMLARGEQFPLCLSCDFDYRALWGRHMEDTRNLASWSLCSLFGDN